MTRLIVAVCIVLGAAMLGFFIPVILPIILVLGFGIVLGLAGVLVGCGLHYVWKKATNG